MILEFTNDKHKFADTSLKDDVKVRHLACPTLSESM